MDNLQNIEAHHDIILVNIDDEPIGFGEKMDVHRRALMHRAFSVLAFNAKGETLLQRRALEKYHSPGLWTNTCCSHPFPGEETLQAALRRTQEEMGFTCSLTYLGKFHYVAPFDNGLTENEVDHVFTGIFNGEPNPDPAEVCETKWIGIQELTDWMAAKPEDFTVWFRIIATKVFNQGKVVDRI